ncbi:hypothetical protein M9Y10_001889 [Tritrichomonas musculus]|uniref:Esterase n=1 Tax=Tritrichomonas musculus TaxID=1915356 RepID=A0ABR2L8A3_9EUKA
MSAVLMLHGYKGTWNNGWFAPIQYKLRGLKIPVISPSLPNPERPDYHQWKEVILNIIDEHFLQSKNEQNIIIVAHSLACFAVLRLIDEFLISSQSAPGNISIINRFKCLILVAPIVSYHQKFPQFTDYKFSLHNHNNYINQIKINPIHAYLIYSIDDNYVDIEVMHDFISNFIDKNQKETLNSEEEKNYIDLCYIEKKGYQHFMQDDIPFITELVVQTCFK